MNIFLDTETDGNYYSKSLSLTHPNQVNIIQLAFQIRNNNKEIVSEYHSLIYPLYFKTIKERAYKIHKISYQNCYENGISPNAAIGIFYYHLLNCSTIIGHNVFYDIMALKILATKCGYDKIVQEIEKKQVFCTQKNSKYIVKLPYKSRGGVKPPTLSEAYQYFFGKELIGAHGAMSDTKGCADVYYEIIKE